MIVRRLLPPALVFIVALAACRKQQEPSFAVTAASVGADATAATSPVAEPASSSAPTLATLLRADDTLATAKARLGDTNVVASELPGAEGETYPGWVLYPGDPSRKIEVGLDGEAVHPLMLQLRGESSVWERPDGVKLGMSIAELQAKNGKPFEFLGFDWDYGGTVVEWHDGSFDPRNAKVIGTVNLCRPEQVPEGYPAGDDKFVSDDPRVVAHPPRVCAFTMNLDGQ
jgi:hypothetical protein